MGVGHLYKGLTVIITHYKFIVSIRGILYSTYIVAYWHWQNRDLTTGIPLLIDDGRKQRKRYPDNCCSLPEGPTRPRPTRRSKWTAVGFVTLLASIFAMAFLHDAYLLYYGFLSVVLLGHTGSGGGGRMAEAKLKLKLCHKSAVLYPESNSRAQLWKSLGRDFDNDVFMTRAVAWLGGGSTHPVRNAYSAAFRSLELPS